MTKHPGFRRSVFTYDRDVPRLQRFLAQMRREVAPAAYFHLGDLLWRIHCPGNAFEADRDMSIWVDTDGDIAGFAFYLLAEWNPEYFLRPDLYGARLPELMVAWSLQVAREYGHAAVETGCAEGDPAKQAMLEDQGFVRIDEPMVCMARSLDLPIDDLPAPAGYAIRPVDFGLPILSATGNAPFSRGAYEAMSRARGYRQDLDIKAYAGDNIVAGCLCWLDTEDDTGELEPVGTHPEHRRRGLAANCIALALRNLRRHGATVAYVRTGEDNKPAVALYRRLGFRVIDRDIGWQRSVAGHAASA